MTPPRDQNVDRDKHETAGGAQKYDGQKLEDKEDKELEHKDQGQRKTRLNL